jgi:hypothetical protein
MKKSADYKFCLNYLYPCCSKDAHKENDKTCLECQAGIKRDPKCKCHHHVLVEDTELEDYKNQVNEIFRLMGESFGAPPVDICNVEFITSGSAGNGTADPKSIWFEPKTTIDKISFS